jgi:CTP synthase
MVERATKVHPKTVTVGVVAKYMDNTDTYLCVFEALKAAAWANDVNIDIRWIDAEKLEGQKDISGALKGVDGIVVPGGFGTRALEGKISAAQYALKNKLPYLGLCLGLQMGVIAAARNAGITDATTEELNPDANDLVISTMAGQKGKENTGGTMRLGDQNCHLAADSLAAKVYGTTDIVERHRHRYECNNAYRDQYEKWGIRASGINPDNDLVEIIEAPDHPFFLASQFHPEFKSRPNRAHPMFDGFIKSLI